MKESTIQQKYHHIGINIIFAGLFVIFIVFSYIMFNTTLNDRLLLRVASRGLFGVLLIYDSVYLIFTNKWSFLSINISRKQRIFSGFMLGMVGIIMLITAFLGFGINGDPRLFWWR